jgi:hypothetical protein
MSDTTPNPQGATLSFNRRMRVSKGSRSREISLVVTREMVGSGGISQSRMKDPELWWSILDSVEDHLNENFESIDEIPDQLGGLAAHLTLLTGRGESDDD